MKYSILFVLAGFILIRGSVSGFGRLKNDNIVDAAFVFSPPNTEMILSLQVPLLIAPKEKITAGPISEDVPGNIYAPKQTESYGIIPITIQKSSFSAPVEQNKNSELFALWFQGNWDELTDGAKKKWPLWKLLQHVKVRGGGMNNAKSWNPNEKTNIDLNLALQKNISWTWNRSAPTQNEFDLTLFLQQTPNQGWTLSDFFSQPSQNGQAQSFNNLNAQIWSLAARIEMPNKDFVSARGWWILGNNKNIRFNNELPPSISNLTRQGDLVSWDKSEGFHWNVLVGVQESTFQTNSRLSIFNIFPNYAESSNCLATTSYWIPADRQNYTIPKTIAACAYKWALVRLDNSSLQADPSLNNNWEDFSASVNSFAYRKVP